MNSKLFVGWAVVAGFFLLIGIDDAIKLHERIGSIYSALVTDDSGEPTAGILGTLNDKFPSYTWQLVVAPVYAALGVFTFVFLFRQLQYTQWRALLVLAVGLFFMAQAMDFIEGLGNEIPEDLGDFFFNTSSDRVVHFSKSIEEFFEMAGTTVFLYVFLRKLHSLTLSITFQVTAPKAEAK